MNSKYSKCSVILLSLGLAVISVSGFSQGSTVLATEEVVTQETDQSPNVVTEEPVTSVEDVTTETEKVEEETKPNQTEEETDVTKDETKDVTDQTTADKVPEATKETTVAKPADALRQAQTTEITVGATGADYTSLADAIANAKDGDTIKVIGDVTEKTTINVDKSLKLLGEGGTVTGNNFSIGQDANLAIGAGYNAVNGTIHVLKGGNYLSEAGTFKNVEVVIDEGATATFTGGDYEANASYIYQVVTVEGTIPEISGGTFNLFDDLGIYSNIYNAAVRVNTTGAINKVSGGTFTSNIGHGVLLFDGGQIDEITGGDFSTTAKIDSSKPAYDQGHSGGLYLLVMDETSEVSHVGKITGGKFSGGIDQVGIGNTSGVIDEISFANVDENYSNVDGWMAIFSSSVFKNNIDYPKPGEIPAPDLDRGMHGSIGKITAGVFVGSSVGLQNDNYSLVGEISGGSFYGSNAVLNVGLIEKITGGYFQAGSTGIWNYFNGQNSGAVTEISGVTIVADTTGISNKGTVGAVHDSVVQGGLYGITNSDLATFGKIYGDTSIYGDYVAIQNSNKDVPLYLEPGLTAEHGTTRFWSRNDLPSYNNEDLVIDGNVVIPDGYHISNRSTLLPARGYEVPFRYLKKFYKLTYDPNGAKGDATTETEIDDSQEFIIKDNTYSNGEMEFTGWNDRADGTGTKYEKGAKLVLPGDVTLYAQWAKKEVPVVKPDPEVKPDPDPVVTPDPDSVVTPDPDPVITPEVPETNVEEPEDPNLDVEEPVNEVQEDPDKDEAKLVAQTDVKKNVATKQATLPQTSESKSWGLTFIGIVAIGFATILGIFSKKRKED